ncbi:MAG TPA: metal-dependent hydrolase [Candidatus Nanoarchaeia archaeon]|nr:metal-dependent hydrolase [Candidatus Nanoarchaeia archaeon]
MPYAVTHVLITILILDLFRHYVFGKEKFPRYLVVLGGIAGLAPDIDIPLGWFYTLITGTPINLHGLFTHSFIFPLLFLLAASLLYWKGNKQWAAISLVIAAGWFLHPILDCSFGGYKNLFWPLPWATSFCPEWGISAQYASIDAILLVVWMVHEEVHKRIKDYL